MEADFQREYGIDLAANLPRMSRRRFMVLLRGLTPESVFRRKHMQTNGGRVSRVITDAGQAEHSLRNIGW